MLPEMLLSFELSMNNISGSIPARWRLPPGERQMRMTF